MLTDVAYIDGGLEIQDQKERWIRFVFEEGNWGYSIHNMYIARSVK
jgi:hypothetical protein